MTTSKQKVFCVFRLTKTESAIIVQRAFRIKFGFQPPKMMVVFLCGIISLKQLSVFVKAKIRDDQDYETSRRYATEVSEKRESDRDRLRESKTGRDGQLKHQQNVHENLESEKKALKNAASQELNISSSIITETTPKTPAERSRDYRARKDKNLKKIKSQMI
ncbi:hypothetical protein TNCV_4182111 [Trichonephila clavipes]|nr:hypothetical protein TNCV_4182111 [Trichonephila clavipes]